MPAGYAPSLTTLATVKTELSIPTLTTTDDAYLTNLISSLSDYISSRCNRVFTYSAAWVENLPAYASTRLIVKHTPVVSITSITYNGGTIASTEYTLADTGKGWIYRATGWYWTASFFSNVGHDPYVGSEGDLYAVTYVGGYVTPQQAVDSVGTRNLPYDLEDACVQAVVSRYQSRGQDRRIMQESLLSASVSYRDVDEIPEVASAIRRYRRIGTGR